jgi:hypothetical protein
LEINGNVHSALALKVTAETYLLLESGSLDRFLAMQAIAGFGSGGKPIRNRF